MTVKVTEHLADRGFAAEPIYLTDLDSCQPASALSGVPESGHWRTLRYTTDTLSGTMILAGPETVAPEVTYPLQVSGWHAVSIGVWADHITPGTTRWYGEMRTFTEVLARLSGDDTQSLLTLPGQGWGFDEQIHELFWKVADLTDRELELGQVAWRIAPGDGVGAIQCAGAKIAYIKLVPLSEDEVEAWQADQRRTDTRRIFVHNDAGGPLYYRPTNAEQIRRHVEHYRDSDMSRLYWEAGGGDSLGFPSKIGRFRTGDDVSQDFERVQQRLGVEGQRILREKGVEPFQVALEHAHKIGLEFHAGYRVAGFHYPPQHDHFNEGPTFYKSHPELRGVDRNGNPTPRISYAYPEARAFVVSLLKEMAGFPIDGICLLYNRRPPLVEYERPLVEGFTAEYGEDPRHIDEDDPRWLSYRARTLTQFMREVREAMDQAGLEQGRGKRLEVSAVVMGSLEENLFHAIDLKAWVDEGLIDVIMPYSSFHDLESMEEAWTDPGDIMPFVSITKGTACKLAPNIMPRQLSPEAIRRRAAALYEAGVDNLFLWDADVLQPRSNSAGSWNVFKRLGHREEIEAWQEAGEPGLDTPVVTITNLGDWDLSYRTPG
jgi:uncharacterized lipoprotein YddW (UPF0748 family)